MLERRLGVSYGRILMTLPIRSPFPPMESRAVDALPRGPEWQFEPKWDGFRCLVFRDGNRVTLQSKSGQTLTRYFPEVVETIRKVNHRRFVIDGEIVIPVEGGRLSFDDLLQRIHPAASRVKRLAAETPATLIVFDLLVDQHGRSLLKLPLAERRDRLERFSTKLTLTGLALSAATSNRRKAESWFRAAGRGMLDGVIAKRLDDPYLSGERAMLKIKPMRTADCVVGGFRYGSHGKDVGSLLLGLFDRQGFLDHVGFTSSLTADQRQHLAPKLKALIRPPGFTGRAPGGPSRWSTKRSSEWQPLAHGLVVEVRYDHFSDGRFRHGTKFVRWRPDKSPKQCTFEQVERRHRKAWKSLIA